MNQVTVGIENFIIVDNILHSKKSSYIDIYVKQK